MFESIGGMSSARILRKLLMLEGVAQVSNRLDRRLPVSFEDFVLPFLSRCYDIDSCIYAIVSAIAYIE